MKANPGIKFEVDLEAQVVKAGDKTYSFKIDDFRRHCMLNGLDSIGLTLQHEDAIAAYENKQPKIYAVTLDALPGLQVMQYHQVATISCRPDKRSAIKLRVTHQSLMPGIFRHFYTIFTRPVTTCVTTETAEIKKASRYYLLAGDFRLSPTPILSHT